jgi:hypothetical protein
LTQQVGWKDSKRSIQITKKNNTYRFPKTFATILFKPRREIAPASENALIPEG